MQSECGLALLDLLGTASVLLCQQPLLLPAFRYLGSDHLHGTLEIAPFLVIGLQYVLRIHVHAFKRPHAVLELEAHL